MKKTILAAVITTLFAATAHSATIYEQDGVQVDIYGDIEINFQKDIKKKADNGVYINVDDADFGFKLGYDLGNGLMVGGVLEISAEGDTVNLGDSYVGVMSDTYGTLTAGKQATIFDDAGIGADYQFGFGSFYDQKDSGRQVIKYKLDTGMFYGGIAYLMSDTTGSADDVSVVDGKIGAYFAGFDLTAFFGVGDGFAKVAGVTLKDSSYSTTNMNFEARYNFSDFQIAAAYATSEQDAGTVSKITTDSIGLAATYSLDKAQFAVGYAMFSNDVSGSDDVNNYYVNASYAFTSNVNTYVEIGGSDADNTDVGYALGMQVKF
ncbi:porin [Psychromonas hadalis]|uniref:porin n=1 Tax=Psychromonas hadalis TaxID=211669 RepID=UPI0003B55788|nr:porin [Psychromonas hadalis]